MKQTSDNVGYTSDFMNQGHTHFCRDHLIC